MLFAHAFFNVSVMTNCLNSFDLFSLCAVELTRTKPAGVMMAERQMSFR
jgi:hypothetical protein